MLTFNRLSDEHARVLMHLLDVWRAKRPRNVLRQVYFDGKQPFIDFGIAIPPQILSRITPTLQWISTGVEALTDRSKLQGFVAAGEGDDPFELNDIVQRSRMVETFPAVALSSAIHSCAFYTVEMLDGDVVVMPRAADMCAAAWDPRRGQVGAFLAIDRLVGDSPVEMTMYLHDEIVHVVVEGDRMVVDVTSSPLGRPSVAAMPFKPTLKRPFGRSRITRAAMQFTDSGLRTIVRAEVQAEAFAGPQYWLLGANAKAFAGSNRFQAVMGRVFGLEQDPDTGEVPDVKRFEAPSPEAQVSQLRMWATLFAGDQNIPVSSLGIVQDNPSSADAIYAAKEDLINDTVAANLAWGSGAVDALRMALELREGAGVDTSMLTSDFENPTTVSPVGKAAAFGQLAPNIPGFASSAVGLKFAGLSQEEIIRFRADQQQAQLQGAVDALLNRTSTE